MKSMNVALMWVGLVAAACGSKTNPDVCCTDAANCAAQGLPDTSQCTGGLICRGNQCVAETCSSGSDCEAGAPFCTSTGLCAMTCDRDSECPGFGGDATDPFCEGGSCVQCRDAASCSVDKPICDSGACRGCTADSECASNVCADNGSCVAGDSVIYIDVAGTDAGTCSQTAPCRTLLYAVTKATPTRFTIVAAPGTYQGPSLVDPATTSTLELDIRAKGATFTQPPGNDGVALQFETGFQSVTIRGANFTTIASGKALRSDSPLVLISCTATSPGTCIDAESGLTAAGLKTTNCALGVYSQNATVLDGVEVSGGTIGVQVGAGSVTIKNLLVHDTSDHAAEFLINATGSVSFSTFANCGLPNGTTARAVTCGNGMSLVSSIVWAPGTVSEVPIAGCAIATSIAGPTALSGTPNSDPLFVDAAGKNYHLQAASPAVDAVVSGPTTDLDGTARPQGAKFDLGAYEYKP